MMRKYHRVGLVVLLGYLVVGSFDVSEKFDKNTLFYYGEATRIREERMLPIPAGSTVAVYHTEIVNLSYSEVNRTIVECSDSGYFYKREG
ncbi:hypothetical protein IBX65_07255 [Candidatus Aerophobetes bacterium]|nr:hypothetical protein [Candidatus Aerophobetes bacterium]